MIPVDRASKDPFFRYKMPQLETTKESNKTVLVNLNQIAKSFYRDPTHIIKFLGMNLGCTQKVDDQKYLLNGIFETNRLQTLIFDYIDTFVLCKSCRNPETRFVFEENVLKRRCSSCGATIPQESHKLNKSILKDIETSANEDTKYEISKGSNISNLLKDDKDNSERLYEIYKQEDLALGDFFTDYFKASNLKQIKRILAEYEMNEILLNVENMVEKHRKEDKIQNFLKALCQMGYPIDDIEAYFMGQRSDRKRSPLIKKNAMYFITNYED